MIDLTPVDVRKKKGDFRRIMRGYDPALVDDFLDLVADRMEELVRENVAMAELSTRQDQQIAEYRERERALTEALVTAQEMREEIRKQTLQETEQARQAAVQEVAQLRRSAEEELESVRSRARQEARELHLAAERESHELRAAAVREAAELRAAAERDATQRRAMAQQESERLLAEARQSVEDLSGRVAATREREEFLLLEVRQRQEQNLATWQSFLEHALAELAELRSRLGSDGEPPAAEADTPAGVVAAAAAPAPATVRETPGAVAPAGMTAPADDFDSPGDDPDETDLAMAAPVVGIDDDGLLPDHGPTESFAPEPFQPEPTGQADMGGAGIDGEFDIGSLERAEPAEPEPQTTPGPEPRAPEPAPPRPGGWAVAPELMGPDLDLVEDTDPATRSAELEALLPEPEADEDDIEVSRLLRNAEAAGYRIPDLDDVEGRIPEVDEPKGGKGKDEDDGWLPSLLEDEQ